MSLLMSGAHPVIFGEGTKFFLDFNKVLRYYTEYTLSLLRLFHLVINLKFYRRCSYFFVIELVKAARKFSLLRMVIQLARLVQ
jgi:hypothetical protein